MSFPSLCPRSPLHGRGLFCKRNIDAGEMVIEYAGNVIRSIQTDKREKYYDSKVSPTLVLSSSFVIEGGHHLQRWSLDLRGISVFY